MRRRASNRSSTGISASPQNPAKSMRGPMSSFDKNQTRTKRKTKTTAKTKMMMMTMKATATRSERARG